MQVAVQNDKLDSDLTKKTDELAKLQNSLRVVQQSNVTVEKIELEVQ